MAPTREAEAELEAEAQTQEAEQPATGDVPEQDEQPHPDEPGDEPGEPEPGEPEGQAAQPAPGLEETIKRFDQLEKKSEGWQKQVVTTLGDLAADLQRCPRCWEPVAGFVLPESIVPLTADKLAAVKLSIGMGQEPELKQATDASTCEACDGEGRVATGSKVPKQKQLRCGTCDGRGWVGPRAASLPPEPQSLAVPAISENGQDDDVRPVTDPWGRVKGDPLFGVLPGFESE